MATTHFICTGDCHGVSPIPKLCGAKSCSRHGKPLIGCQCTDGKHQSAGTPRKKR